MALVTKFSSALLIPIIGLTMAALLLRGIKPDVSFAPGTEKPNSTTAQSSLQAGAVLSDDSFFRTSNDSFQPYLFQGYRPWISGFQHFMTIAEEGLPAFLVGEYSSHGWWSYFMFSFLIKTPLGSLILIAASLVFYRGRRSSCIPPEAIFLVVPVLYLFSLLLRRRSISGFAIFF